MQKHSRQKLPLSLMLQALRSCEVQGTFGVALYRQLLGMTDTAAYQTDRPFNASLELHAANSDKLMMRREFRGRRPGTPWPSSP